MNLELFTCRHVPLRELKSQIDVCGIVALVGEHVRWKGLETTSLTYKHSEQERAGSVMCLHSGMDLKGLLSLPMYVWETDHSSRSNVILRKCLHFRCKVPDKGINQNKCITIKKLNTFWQNHKLKCVLGMWLFKKNPYI